MTVTARTRKAVYTRDDHECVLARVEHRFVPCFGPLTLQHCVASNSYSKVVRERIETASKEFATTPRGLTLNQVLVDWRATVNGTRICSLAECDRPFYGLDLCRMHYVRFKRNGTTDLRPHVYVPAPIADRLAKHSKWEGDCLVWTAYRDKNGYGSLKVKGRTWRASRLAYEIVHGDIPEGMVIRHKCDNPPCINTEHLEVGSNWDNQQDKVNRRRSTAGSKNAAAILNEAQVLEIRRALDAGEKVGHLAKQYGVGMSTVSRINMRVSWKLVLGVSK